MPDTISEHVDDPTFEKIRAACRKRGVRVTVLARNGASVTCRTEVKGNVATIDFDLWQLGSNFSEEAQHIFRDKYDSCLKANLKQFKGAKSRFFSSFGATGIRFHVLEKDANKWFDDIYGALLDPANFTPIPCLFDKVKKTARLADAPDTADSHKPPVSRKRPADQPFEPPEIMTLRAELSALERPQQPKTPETIKKIQKLLKSYERPSSITRYVKQTRGSTCQLCGFRGFRTRKGKLYCEVHHLFHLSNNPPPMCLGPEHLIVLCATCHRRMHYADVGEPRREETGWRVSVDGHQVLFTISRSATTGPTEGRS
jgi:5-methylcytosine-specific restriction endonuclease McrA